MGRAKLRKGAKMNYTAKTSPTPADCKSRCLPMLFGCLLLILSSLPAPAGAAVLPETAKLVPPETILLLDIDSFSQLRTNFEKTSVYKLYKDPAMTAFVDDFKTKWRDTTQEQDNEFARIVADLGVLPQGRVAVAFVLGEQTKDTNEPPVLFISEWGENIDKVRETMDKIVQKAIDDGARRETEDYRGTNITVVSTKPSEAFGFCFVDDCLMGSLDPDILKFTIAQIKGAGSPTLADDADYNATTKTLGSRPGPAQGRIDFYVNIKQIVRAAMAEDAQGQVKAIVSNLGFDNVTSLGCSIELAGDSSFAKAFLKIDGAKKGICRMLDIESAPLRVPRFVSDSACSISFVHLNLEKVYTELATILNSFSPQFAAMLYMPLVPASPDGEPAVQLKGDMIDHLGSQIIIAQNLSKPSGDAGASRPAASSVGQVQSILALAINNRSALEKSLSLLHSKMLAANNPDARRELLGHTIYLVDVSGFLPMFEPTPPGRPGAETSGPKPPPLAFTVTDTHLIFASEPIVERAIRSLSSPGTASLSSAEWFARAKSTIPSAVGFAGLQDTAVAAERLWSGLRQAKKAGTPGGEEGQNQISVGMSTGSIFPMLDLTQAGSSLFDFGLLPQFDAVRKYFGLSASYAVSRQDGFFFELKYLSPDTAE